MDTKIINTYNERSQRRLTSGLVIVDAAQEPLRVLKVLMEGLGPDVRAGLWLTNFKGVPVARTLSPFDLIYLDKEYRVVHCVEISTQGEYEPFRGDPASALVLPPTAILTSRTRPGDKLLFRAEDGGPVAQASIEGSESAARADAKAARRALPQAKPQTPAPAAPSVGTGGRPDQPAHFFNAAFPVPPPENVGIPLDQFLAARGQNGGNAAAAASEVPAPTGSAPNPMGSTPGGSGRLTKTSKSVLGLSPAFRPPSTEDAGGGAFYGGRGSSASAAQQATFSGAGKERVQPAASATRIIQAHSARVLTAPAETGSEARPPSMVHSGRLMKGAQLAEMVPLPELEAAATQVAVTDIQEEMTQQAASPLQERHPAAPAPPLFGVVIPITSAPGHAAQNGSAASEGTTISETSFATPADQPEPTLIAPETATPTSAAPPPTTFLSIFLAPEEDTTEELSQAPAPQASPAPVSSVQAAPPRQSEPAVEAIPQISQPPARRSKSAAQTSVPLPAAPVHPPSDALLPVKNELPVFPRTVDQGRDARKDEIALRKKKPSWDVKLLYTLFPEFDPSRPPEIRIPCLGDEKKQNEFEDEERSLKLQLLSWLYPDLELEKVKQKRSEERRAVRLPMPGLVAYFFTGGAPRPHPIKDISVTGFYMCTQERWLPGTIVRVTLQMVDSSGQGGRDSITVHSRVVRWGPDGGGFEFVLPGFLES